MPTLVLESLQSLKEYTGREIFLTEWLTMSQERINQFADATGDHQWIHVDPERAKAGPFGGPIAHGYLTLSMVPVLLNGVMKVDGVAMGVNYGTNKVRFTSPVPVGSEIRAGATLASVDEVAGGVQVALDVVVEVKDAPKPSCVAQVVFRYYR